MLAVAAVGRGMATVAMFGCMVMLLFQTAHGAKSRSAEQMPEGADSTFFERVARILRDDTSSKRQLVVDARPMRNDPRLVTLSRELPKVIPERVSPDAHEDVLVLDESAKRKRMSILTRLAVREGDALLYADCPGTLTPTVPAIVERKRQNCPNDPIDLVLIALPRKGGVYWPDNFDERGKYGESAYTVRVIVTSVSSQGRLQVSTDYVFTVSSVGGWELREKRHLLIVE